MITLINEYLLSGRLLDFKWISELDWYFAYAFKLGVEV